MILNKNDDLSKNSSPQKSKNQKEDIEDLPSNQCQNIESTITAMLDKVMEDKEINVTKSVTTDFDSLQFIEEEENEEKSIKPTRNGGKHQTSIPLSIEKAMLNKMFNYPNINRGNKRYQTVNCNQIANNNNELNDNNNFNANQFLFQLQNNMKNFKSDRELNKHNNHINNLNMNNYPIFNQQQIQYNQMMVTQTANFIRSNFPSKTVVYHYNQNNEFLNINNNLLSNNVYNNYNNINNSNNGKCINPNMENFDYKRNDKRKKTYDVPVYKFLKNNNNGFIMQNINNINNPEFNNQFLGFAYQQQQNNIIMNNNNYCNMTNNQINNINNNTNNNNTNSNIVIDDAKVMELKSILEKSGKIDHYIYNNIKGKILPILKNHKGSRIFQKYLKSTHCDILHQIFIELSYNLEELFTDPYANYFCKKFFTYLNQKDRVDLLKGIEKSMVKLSSDGVGTYTIQTIIEHVGSKNEKIIIVNALKDHIRELSFDPFGSHVLERLLTYFEEEYIAFIYSYVANNFLELASDNNGIIIIKKILIFTHKKALHDKIKNIVIENALTLIKHPYANLVIQVIIESWPDYKDILVMYEGKYFSLSLEKYASNVVERCLEKDQNILNKYIDEIVASEKIYEVMKSNYGNYVIQKAIKLAKNEYKQKLVFNASKYINKLNDPKLIIKWKSILMPYIKEIDKDFANPFNE